MTATLLSPSPILKFFDNNGAPLALGKLTTYAGGTVTPIATYTDSTGVTQNTNPIILNFRGEAPIWLLPNVNYKYALTDAAGNTIPGYPVDNIVNAALITLFGGVDTGVANAYILNFATPVAPNTNGQLILWLPANSNTGPSTINVNGGGAQPILNPNGSALGANQILANQFVQIVYINGIWQLYGGSGVGVNVGTFGAEVPLTAAATTDLGSVPGHNVQIVGTTQITSFGVSAQLVAPIYIGRFTNTLTLTNSAALMLPGGNNILTGNGDSFIAEYLGSGAWKVLFYQVQALIGFGTSVKAGDTARLSTTTLAADPDLAVALLTGQYEYELFMLFDSVAAGAGFKFQSTGTAVDSRGTSPSIADGLVNAAAYGPKLESFVGGALSYATVGTAANSNGVLYKGSLLVTTPGTFGIQWAQVASTASNTTLRAGSYLTATLLGQKTGSASPIQHLITTAGAGTENIPSGYSTLTCEVWGGTGRSGAGFNGGGGNSSGGGASGSGAYCRTVVSVSGAGGQTINWTCGAAGGLTGGTSIVNSGSFAITTMTATGSAAGGNAPSLGVGGAGGAGGTASGGNVVNTPGNAGGAGTNNAGGGGPGAIGLGIPGINYGGPNGVSDGFSNVPGSAGVISFYYS